MSKLYTSTNVEGQAPRNKQPLFREILNQTQQAYNRSYTARCFGTHVCFSFPGLPYHDGTLEGGGFPHLPVVLCYNLCRHKYNDQGLNASQGKQSTIIRFIFMFGENKQGVANLLFCARVCVVAAALLTSEPTT